MVNQDSGRGSTTSGNETYDAATGGPLWFLLRTRSSQERKVADALQAKGCEVFLPMHTVRRQWSDRLKTYDAPLFPGYLFCRFSLTRQKLLVLKTPGLVLIYPCVEKPVPLPDLEVERLRRITASRYPIECCDSPQTGEVVEMPGDIPIRGVLVERGTPCRVAIGFEAMGRTVVLHVPLGDLNRVEGPLTPHWSLGAL
jgi:transcription antitermination factor NusG